MEAVRSSLLVVHGKKDTTVPYHHGLELYRLCRSRKLFVGPDNMGHNADMFADVSYMVLPMLHFFALPDYCFAELHVPNWAYDRHASLWGPEPSVPAAFPAKVHAPWEDGLTDADSREHPEQQHEGAAVPEAPQLPVVKVAPVSGPTIRQLTETQERTASRSRLAAVSDQHAVPLPSHEHTCGRVCGHACVRACPRSHSCLSCGGNLEESTEVEEPLGGLQHWDAAPPSASRSPRSCVPGDQGA